MKCICGMLDTDVANKIIYKKIKMPCQHFNFFLNHVKKTMKQNSKL